MKTYATAVVVILTGVLTLSATPAFAAYDYTSLDNGRGYGHIDGNYVSACDTKADNRGVVTEYSYDDHNEYGSIVDWNGSDSGCGATRAPSDIDGYQVCLQQPGSSAIDYCTEWKSFS